MDMIRHLKPTDLHCLTSSPFVTTNRGLAEPTTSDFIGQPTDRALVTAEGSHVIACMSACPSWARFARLFTAVHNGARPCWQGLSALPPKPSCNLLIAAGNHGFATPKHDSRHRPKRSKQRESARERERKREREREREKERERERGKTWEPAGADTDSASQGCCNACSGVRREFLSQARQPWRKLMKSLSDVCSTEARSREPGRRRLPRELGTMRGLQSLSKNILRRVAASSIERGGRPSSSI